MHRSCSAVFRAGGGWAGARPQPRHALPGWFQAGGFFETDGWHRLHLEHGHALQHAYRPTRAEAEAGANAAGGKAIIFNTITISDGISMGTEGMKYSLVSREVIADSIETVVGCEGMDGFVAIGGCDKNMPGRLSRWRG